MLLLAKWWLTKLFLEGEISLDKAGVEDFEIHHHDFLQINRQDVPSMVGKAIKFGNANFR